MGIVGGPITLLFCLGLFGNDSGAIYMSILVYITLFGLGWDGVYMTVQSYRWDQDWPAAFQWLGALWEGFFFLLIRVIFDLELPFTDVDAGFPVGWFLLHYSLVWVGIFIASQSFMRILFPRWRFQGGQWF